MKLIFLMLTNFNKYKIILFVLLFTLKLSSQNKISISMFNDVKLALAMDKEHKNPNPTLDLIININLEGKQLNGYYFAMQPFYEHANLGGGYYRRYGVNSSWTFNNYHRIENSILIGFSMIHRHKVRLPSYQIGTETTYQIFKGIKLALKYEFNRRGDIQKFRHNVYGGVKFDLVNL